MKKDEEFFRSPMVRHTTKRRWNLLCKYLKTRSGIAMVKKFSYCLSFVLDYGAPKKVVKIILKSVPDVTQSVNELGMIPLHVACLSGVSSDIIKMLIAHDMKWGREQNSVMAVDTGLNTPLHYIAKHLVDPLGLEGAGRSSFSVMATCSVVSTDDFQDLLISVNELVSIAPQVVYHKNRKMETAINILEEYEKDNKTSYTCNWRQVLFPVFRRGKDSSISMSTENEQDDVETICSISHSLSGDPERFDDMPTSKRTRTRTWTLFRYYRGALFRDYRGDSKKKNR